MNAIRVSERAMRKLGTLIMVIFLALIALRQAKAGQIDITVTGVLTGGWDTKGLFFQGAEAKTLGGKPFTLVFTFDDGKGYAPKDSNCVSGRLGGGQGSPGTAVLTMGNGTYKFGANDNFESGVSRRCDGSMLSMEVDRKASSSFDHTLGIDVRIVPTGNATLPKTSDWRSPMSATNVTSRDSCMIIADSMNGGKEVHVCFDVKKVEISASKPAE
jgi:hypothetical protein